MNEIASIRRLSLDDSWLLKAAIEKGCSAFYLLTPDGTICYVNDRACQFLGFSPEELVGKPVWALDPDCSPQTWGPLWAKLKHNGIIEFETQHRRKDGTEFPVGVTGNCVAHAGEEFSLNFFEDLTERRQVEAALKDQEEFFRLIAENVADFIAVLDLDGRRIYSSPSYQRFFGSTQDLRGTDSFADIHPDDLLRVKDVFSETVRTGVGHAIEYRFVLPSGRLRHMESRGGVVLNEEGGVRRVVVVSHDITERKTAELRMLHLAHHDALTDLPNRALMTDRLHQSMAQARRDQAMLAVMFLDLDKFKPVNDTLGHDVGDLLLKEVAIRLQDCVQRDSDTVSRIGGDEFVILLGRIKDEQDAAEVAEKLIQALSQPFQMGPHRAEISASIGIALYPRHGEDAKLLIKKADVAMYRAKDDGQNCYRFFDDAMGVVLTGHEGMGP